MRDFSIQEILDMDSEKLRSYIKRNEENIKLWRGEVAKTQEHNRKLKIYLGIQKEHGR